MQFAPGCLAQSAIVEVPPDSPSIIALNAAGPVGVALTISIEPNSGPTFGTLGPLTQPSNDRPAEVVYVPRNGFVGEDLFQFRACGTISDQQVCDVGTIRLAVKGPETSGELAPDVTVSTESGSSLPITLIAGAPPTTRYRVLTLPSDGTLTDSNGVPITNVPYALPSPVVVYQSSAGFTGTVTFTYDATDGQVSDTGTVTVSVLPGPDNGR